MQEEPTQPDLEVSDPPSKVAATSRWRHWHRFKNWYGTHKKWSLPASILLVLIILAVVPWTRYHTAGLFLKKDFTLKITDSTANTPVSGALVNIGSVTATTNGGGQATLHGIKVGDRNISINKKYYQTKTAELLVPILNQKNTPSVSLIATGRQVKINVTNIITNKVLANVDINVGDANAKTDSSGNALLVLPANATTQKGKLSLDSYNDSDVTVQVSNSSVKENDFKLTPTGKVYFLSNQTGNLNLMKANLDGTSPEVAVAGTGSEQVSETSMLQSADGRYVALATKRSAGDSTPQLYVLSATDDKLLQADAGNAIFQLYAWVGDTLVYTVQRQDLPAWQQGVSKIKAYDASTGTTTPLDQTAGSDSTVNANEYYSEVMVSGPDVIYGKVWHGSGDFSSKQNSLQIIGVDGQSHQTLASYNVSDTVYFAQHNPDTLYIWQHTNDKQTDIYSQYSLGGSVKPAAITNDQFYKGAYSYFFSYSGKLTFWSENRDGKNTLLVGDQSGSNTSTVASLSDYSAYGWYTDNYLLLSKNGSELYVIGIKGGSPIKITNYQSTGYYGGR